MITESSHSPVNDPADFASLLAAAEEWTSAALGAQQEGLWALTETERRVLADVVVATNPLHGGRLPPHDGESVHVRLGRIRNWAGVLRLAARAGGWDLHPVVGSDPSFLTRPIGMPDLLSGIYALAEQGERWQQLMLTTIDDLNAKTRRQPQQRPGDLDQALAEREPRFARDLAAAERFFTGPGSLEDLLLFFY
ncbi:hypothetical protein [Kitasatospora sp. NPDC002040]|uniref:hypothetical protein n=1 Tax=Kitasatospora sp. NPDC002040 TaxID=3154661 RepID=UPI0033313E6D